MALAYQIPPGSEFRQPLIQFTAVFNAVTPGFYDWNSAANTRINFAGAGLALRRNHLYIFDRYSFWADVTELSFSEALNGGVTPTLSLTIPSQTDRQLYPEALPMGNFVDGLETFFYADASQNDQLQGTFRGRLTQPASLVGTASITVFFQPNVYEIKNVAWINNFLGRTRGGVAPGLLGAMRGH